MRIAGQDYLIEQNDRLKSKLQENMMSHVNNTNIINNDLKPSFDSTDKTAVASNNIIKERETVKVDFTNSARIAGSNSDTSGSFPSVNFSTGNFAPEDEEASTSDSSKAVGESILNQYRFFVQSKHYAGNDGVVKRIFR